MTSDVQTNWGWFLVLGGVWILLGLFAIAAPHVVGLAIGLLIGWMFVLGGVAQIVHTMVSKEHGRVILRIALGILYLVAGAYLLKYPEAGAITLTFFLGWFILIEGVAKIVWAFQMRGLKGWVWMLLSGGISLVLAVLILRNWPSSAAWVIGLFVGLNLLFTGWGLVMLAVAAKAAGRMREA